MPRTKLEEIIESSDIKEFSQFFRLKTRAEGNFRPSDEQLSQYDDAEFFGFTKLGQVEFSGSERLLVVSAKVGKNLSERSGKKAQYEKAKKILRELSAYSAGIFIFYDKGGSFRFSLVYPEAVGTRREWSNFRRFTYFVSKELTNKTFLQRIGDGDFSTMEKIKDAFSVEKVTKEFYLEYRKLFDSLVEDLSKNHTFLNGASKNRINTENFAKKLLGQIVFLYFIQKKGWLGVPAGKRWGEGDKNFMGNIYKDVTVKKTNFYNDYLEKLFYNALNNPHRDSADPSFSKDFNSRIPFLNGGLFEAEYDWKSSLMYLDNKIFRSIFDVFERYNFTVEEESPDDKEIAVDPEMLGKVFENLLPENMRKGKGTYYTPREIVYCMCRESLVNYLVSNHSNITEVNIRNYIFYSESFENFKKQKGESFTPGQWKELDDLLTNIRVCDPACGSGAFLVGMLNMIVKLRIFLQTTPDSHIIPQKKEYELKCETIQNCIYGVDIDPGAIEIAKLRLWLALVVDYDLEDIEPLPNLDYRLMCGNSLLEEFEGVKFYNGEEETQATLLPVDPEKQKKVEALKKKVKEYFSVHDDNDKLKKRKEINGIKDWLIGTALKRRYQDLASQRKEGESRANMLDEKNRKQYLDGFSKWLGSSSNIQQALESLHNPKKEKPFFIWKLEFIDVFEEKGGFDVMIANPPYVDSETMTKDDERFRETLSNIYKTAKGNWDLFIVFIERGLQLLNPDATITYIVPNKLIAARYSEKLRGLLLTKNILELRDYSNVNVFKEVDVYPIVFLIQNNDNRNDVVMSVMQSETEVKLSNKVPATIFYQDIHWGKFFSPKAVLDILLKMSGYPNLGSLSGGVSDAATVSEAYQIKEYITERNSRLKDGYKKLINTGSIDRYISFWGKQKTQYIKGGYLEPVILDKDLKKISITRFQQAASEKIIIAGMSKELECFYDSGEYLAGKSTTIILKDNLNKEIYLKYIFALLNSNLVSFWFKNYFGVLSLAGGYLQINNKEIEKIPAPVADSSKQKKLINLVDKILAITKDSDYLDNSVKQAKVRDYEKQIDQLVYKLYGLTPKEMEIIERHG